MTRPDAVVLDRRVVHEGRIFRVVIDRVQMPHQRVLDLELVRHPGSVVLVPTPEPGCVVLVRQYRHAIAQWIWELPAGGVEPGEEIEAAARRECEEEIDLSPGRLELLGQFHPTPGYCDERMVFFRAHDLSNVTRPVRRDADEDLEPRVFALEEARRLVATGQITDMKTALGLTLIV